LLSFIGTALIAILVFGFIIFAHELGHYLAARWAGITISEFAIGMGPILWSWTDKLGIRYSLRLLPIGGFLAMEGEEEDSADPNAYNNAPPMKRMVVIGAGALVNLLCGFLILLILANTTLVGLTTVAAFDDPEQPSAQILRQGDEILRINDRRVYVASDVSWQLFRTYDGVVQFTVRRDGRVMDLPLVNFKLVDQGDGFKSIHIDFIPYGKYLTLGESFGYTAKWALSLMRQVWGSAAEIFTGRIPMTQISGPVGVASAIGAASRVGMNSLLMMTAFISINIGLMNLLPLPMLDGGKLILIFLEGLLGFKLGERVENAINLAGFAFLMLVMAYVTLNDLMRLL
jgi:regulator of sigma E protease